MNLYAVTAGLSRIVGSLSGGLIYENWGGARFYLICGLLALTVGISYFIFLNLKEKKYSEPKTDDMHHL